MADRDMRKLEALERVLANPDGIREALSGAIAEECLGLIAEGFRRETDPYGRRWKPKQKPDGRKTLSGPTSRLKNGWHIKRQAADQIVIAPSVDYAAAHQDPLPRARASSSETLRRRARGIDTGRATSFAGADFNGPMQLKRPRRMMVPDEVMGLPPKWERALNEAATDALAQILGGDGRRVSGLRKRLRIDALVGFKVG